MSLRGDRHETQKSSRLANYAVKDRENDAPSLSFDRLYVEACLIDPTSLTIRSRHGVSRIEPKVMALLQVLAERPASIWTREEILDRIWPDGDGGDDSLTRLVYLLRKAFSDDHHVSGLIGTISKRGYRLDATVKRAPWQDDKAPAGDDLAPLPYSIAVLPMVMTGDRNDLKLLRDGMTRDLASLLSRVSGLRVAPDSSASYYTGKGFEPAQIARALDVRYLVHTDIAKLGNTVTVRVELADSSNNHLIWSEKYVAEIDHFPEIQDAIALSISTAVSTGVKISWKEQPDRSRPFTVDAYKKVQLAKNLRTNYGPDTAKQIEIVLMEALDLEPGNALAKAELAVQLSQNIVSKWADDEPETKTRANQYIAEALALQPNDPDVIACAGVVSAMFHAPDDAISYLNRAVQMDPSNANAWAVLGWQKCLRHADRSGLDDIRSAESRAPHHPRFGLWATYRCTAHLFMLEHELGEAACRNAIVRTPNYYQPHCSLAWAQVGLGNLDGARTSLQKARKFGDEQIAVRFSEEMRNWSSNSVHRKNIWRVLDQLADLS